MNMLQQHFLQAGFPEAAVEKITNAFTLKAFAKDGCFVEEGKTSRYLGFVETGLFQYFLLKDGEEKTTYIATANTFMASLFSYLKEAPSREYIRALTPAKVWVIRKDAVDTLLNDLPQFKDYYLGLLEWQICCIDKSRFDLITLTAEQRYEKMLRDEPELLRQIPLQYLASILGVTPRHLSRIRKNFR